MTDSPTVDDAITTPTADETPDRDAVTSRVRDRETVTEAVVRAVRSGTGADGGTLSPLYSTIDTDALNRLFADRDPGPDGANAAVEFGYVGHRVRVNSGGEIRVVPEDPQ